MSKIKDKNRILKAVIQKTKTRASTRLEARSNIFFAANDGKALYSQQKQDWKLTIAQIMNYVLPNSDLS